MHYRKISKTISHALRHAPAEYGLELDSEGFAPLEKLLHVLNEMRLAEKEITESDILYMMSIMEKQRFEILDGKIRALYGHSFSSIIQHKEAVPPEVLFHGTAHKFLDSIRAKGLVHMGRQFVHLSEDIETAITVGKRRDKQPVILVVDTVKARKAGVRFFVGNNNVWLSENIPVEFIKEI